MDFTYDSYDSSTLKVNFQNLRKTEQQAFWMGIILGTPIGTWIVSRKSIQHKFTAGPLSKVLSSLFVGSLIYGAWIFNARQEYNTVAAKINRKYAVIFNKAMTYD